MKDRVRELVGRLRRVDRGLGVGGAVLKARLRGHPVMLSHLVTGRCDACCATCLWRDPGGPELDMLEAAWLYREAAAMGITQLVAWGGEPLLRADLPELLGTAKDAGLAVVLITNGWLLPERWPELAGNVDALILSLDDVGEAHDRLRGLPGLFARLDEFASDLRHGSPRPRLLVNTVLSSLNRGALRRVAPIAQRWGAGLYFCPMETGQMRASGFTPLNDDISLRPAELRDAARLVRILKRAGFPLMATDRYLDLLERDPALTGYSCRAPRAILTVQADGTVRDCLRRDVPLADATAIRARGGHLSEVFGSPRYRQMLEDAGTCTACNNPDVLETSWLWDLEFQMLGRAGRLLLG